MDAVLRSRQDMLQYRGMGMAGRQATTSTRGTRTRQLRTGLAPTLPQELQGRLQDMMLLAMTPWVEALRYGPSIGAPFHNLPSW